MAATDATYHSCSSTPLSASASRTRSLSSFNEWVRAHITGEEKVEAQIFIDRLFQAFGYPDSLEVGVTAEFRVRKAKEDSGGTSFADYVWHPVILIEMKKCGEKLTRHYRQAFDYWTRLVPGRPRNSCASVFDSFPWLQSLTKKAMLAVAEAGREVRRIRAEALPNIKGGLRELYRTLELPGANPLKAAHAALDTAVLAAYGFLPAKDVLAQLLSLNQSVAANIESGAPVTAPGLPADDKSRPDFITPDRIQPTAT